MFFFAVGTNLTQLCTSVLYVPGKLNTLIALRGLYYMFVTGSDNTVGVCSAQDIGQAVAILQEPPTVTIVSQPLELREGTGPDFGNQRIRLVPAVYGYSSLVARLLTTSSCGGTRSDRDLIIAGN